MSKPVIYGQGNKRKSAAEDERLAKYRRAQLDASSGQASGDRFAAIADATNMDTPMRTDPSTSVDHGIQGIRASVNEIQLRQAARRLEAQRLRAESAKQEDGIFDEYMYLDKPHPEADTYQDRPNSLKKVPVALRMGTAADKTFGTLGTGNDGLKDDFAFFLTCDFGQRGVPFVSLTVSRKRNMTEAKPLVELEDEKVIKATFVWSPSISSPTPIAGKKYQLDDCTWSAMSRRHRDAAVRNGIFCRGGTHDYIENAFQKEWDEYMTLFKFTGHAARIDSTNPGIENVMRANVSDPLWKRLMDYLFREQDVTLSLFFLIPESYSLSSGDSPKASEFVRHVTPVFQKLLDERRGPFEAYVDKDNMPAISPEMPLINTFGNRMHVVFHEVNGSMWSVVDGRKTCRAPDAIHTYPRKPFSNKESFGVVFGTSLVRQHQYRLAERLTFSRHSLKMTLFKTFRGSRTTRLVSPVQRLQETTFYAVLHRQKDLAQWLPPANSCWNIIWLEKDLTGEIVYPDPKDYWTAIVREFKDGERDITGGAALLVCTKPHNSQEVPALNNFVRCTDQNALSAMLVPIENKIPLQRQLNAILQFATREGDTNFNRFRNALIFGMEKYESDPINLITMNAPNSMEKHYQDLWDAAFELSAKDLNQNMIEILTKVYADIKNPLQGIFGGPGCQKTTFMALSSVLLGLVQHKLLILSVGNNCLDSFAQKLVDVRQRLLDFAVEKANKQRGIAMTDNQTDLDDADKSDLRAHKVNDAIHPNLCKDLVDRLRNQSYYRFLPPSDDQDMTLARYHALAEQPRPNDDYGTTTLDDWQQDTKVIELHTAAEAEKVEALRNEEAAKAAEFDVAQAELFNARADRNWQNFEELDAQITRIRDDYERLPGNQLKGRRVPLEVTTAYLIKKLRSVPLGTLEADFTVLESIRDHLDNLDTECSDEEHQSAVKDLYDVVRKLQCHIIEHATVVITTYSNAHQETLIANFKPSIAIHEESSRANAGTMATATVFDSIKVHIATGDPKQLRPDTCEGATGNEFFEYMAKPVVEELIEKEVKFDWLNQQRRGHPSLLEFWNQEFYGGLLTHAPGIEEDNPIRSTFRAYAKAVYKKDLNKPVMNNRELNAYDFNFEQLFALDVRMSVSMVTQGTTTRENHGSAAAVVRFVTGLLQFEHEWKGQPFKIRGNDVSILTFYTGQHPLIRVGLHANGIEVRDIMTIDAFQGRDNNIIVLDAGAAACVTSMMLDLEHMESAASGASLRSGAFMKNGPRWYAASTKGKDATVIVGNLTSFGKAVQIAHGGDHTLHVIQNLLMNLARRDLIRTEDSEDRNPAFQVGKGREHFEDLMDQLRDFRWTDYMQDRQLKTDVHRPPPKTSAVFSGPNVAGPLAAFPPDVAAEVKERGEGQKIIRPTQAMASLANFLRYDTQAAKNKARRDKNKR
ncbi:hypothetical protein LTR72_010480 [Exophiala xenobiotica]|nr:hypothetical protein LTR72_010480 [Exophiala xenobiotica]KAK5296211.1 hypothetical protein LTR14_003842 [Exophiala xenobiotica]KAK5472471.1 Protein zgrf1 [Exophiala xenobiotica]